LQGVQRERHRPPYAYTVGLAAHDSVAEHVVHADAPRPGEVVPLRGGPVIEIVRVAEPSAHLAVAAELNGPQFSALQLVRRRAGALALGRRLSRRARRAACPRGTGRRQSADRGTAPVTRRC
jgi:hypothetical protein